MTNHKPHTYLNSKPAVQLSIRQARWQQFLSRFHFEWEYCKGVHGIADPISRNPALHALQAHDEQSSCSCHTLYAHQAKDSGGDVNMEADADMDIYDSLNVSSQFLQNVPSGYSDPLVC